VDFGTGFVRLALRTRSPVVPFAFLGGGDAIPTVTNLYKVGRLLGLPYLPVTPWLLPLPRPVGLSVHFGEPMRFEGTGAEDDDTMHRHADVVKARIAELIERGRR
jgi:1-acyl-sn-glycerol-3-phosphate acyltransferase